jgi:type I restriction enzyme, S subunit
MVPYLRVANVFEDRIDLSDVMQMHFEPKEVERFELAPGDILLNEGQSRELVGRPAMYRGELPGACFTNSLVRFQASEAVEKKYALELFRYWLKSGFFQSIAQITTNIAHLGAGRFAELDFPLAPLNEQRRIVAKLEALQARSRRAREALDAVPSLLEKLRQSILAAAFRGDLTKDWRAQNPNIEPASALLARIRTERREKWEESELAKLKAKGKPPTDDRWRGKYKEPERVDTTGLPELPEGWCWVSLEESGLIESGQTTDGLSEHVSSKDRHVPWFRVGDMNHEDNAEFMTSPEIWLSEADVRHFGLHVRPPGTIIFPKRGGAIATNKKRRLARPSAYDLNTMGVVPIDLLADYLWTWFQTVDLGQLNTGTSVPQINHRDIAPLALPVPGLHEIARVAKAVEAAFARLRNISDAYRSATTELADLDRSTLARAFRGELVPPDPNDEPADVMLARLNAKANTDSGQTAGTKQTKRRSGGETGGARAEEA